MCFYRVVWRLHYNGKVESFYLSYSQTFFCIFLVIHQSGGCALSYTHSILIRNNCIKIKKMFVKNAISTLTKTLLTCENKRKEKQSKKNIKFRLILTPWQNLNIFMENLSNIKLLFQIFYPFSREMLNTYQKYIKKLCVTRSHSHKNTVSLELY